MLRVVDDDFGNELSIQLNDHIIVAENANEKLQWIAYEGDCTESALLPDVSQENGAATGSSSSRKRRNSFVKVKEQTLLRSRK